MSEMNHHFRNMHLQNLVDQNEQLRHRIAKLTEIEGYVQLLVQKLEKADARERSLSSENTTLRQHMREIEMRQNQVENMHGEEMRYVFGQHDQLVQEKNMTINQLKGIIENESAKCNQIETELRFQKTNQQKKVAEYEEALIKYRNRVGQLQQDLNIVYKNLDEEKLHHIKTKDTWISQVNQFKQALIEKQHQNSRLREEVKALITSNQQIQLQVNSLIEYNGQVELKMRQRDEENAKIIISLKESLNQLDGNLAKKREDCERLNAKNVSLLSDIDEYKETQLRLKSDNEIYVTDNQRLIFLLEESDKENAHLRDKNRQLEEYSAQEIDKLKMENVRLRQENSFLSKNNAERQTYLGTKLIQLKQANAARSSLQIFAQQNEQEVLVLRQELKNIQNALLKERDLSTELELQRKQYLQAVKLLKQENMNIEEINKKIQRQNHQLSNQNHELSRILTNPRQQNKEYAEQMDKMVKSFHQEREEQNLRHKAERDKLKQFYQYELRQKQMQLMRQIAALQQQMTKTARLEVLIERENKPSASKTQFRTPIKL